MIEHQASAEFSPCGLHRLRLDRWWSDAPRALVMMANPSKAGVKANDPTVCRLFDLLAHRPAIGGFTVMNAESYIATDPADLVRWRDALGLDTLRDLRRENLQYVRDLSYTAATRIVAWGALVPPGLHRNRVLDALSLDGLYPLHAFGLTNDGAPKHPMARGHHRIPNDAPLIAWKPVIPHPSSTGA